MIFTIICFYWGFDNTTETVVFVCNLWPLCFRPNIPIWECDERSPIFEFIESNFVRDDEIIHIIWVPWMASVNLMTHLKLSSLKMSTKSFQGGWGEYRVPTSFVAHTYLGERPRSNKLTMLQWAAIRLQKVAIIVATMRASWTLERRASGGTILGSYRPITSHNGGRKGKDMIHIYSIMYKYTRVIGRRAGGGASIRHDNDNMIWLWPGAVIIITFDTSEMIEHERRERGSLHRSCVNR